MVPLNESFPSAMVREAYEEAGIEPGTIAFYFCSRHLISRPVHEGWMRENTILFNADVSDSFRPHNVDGEVEKFELMTPDDILDRMEAGLFTFESSLSILVGLAAKEGMPTELDLY
ncbi:NUDIX domain-containing protein [uncultured Parasutterella sp.]|nr:NUDIX domain-containing protein [uncultured Parasutterella sp.]